MTADMWRPEPPPQAWATDGVSVSKRLTLTQLQTLRDALSRFQCAIDGTNASNEESSPEDKTRQKLQAREQAHCLVVTGYIGSRYGTDRGKDTAIAVAERCVEHFTHLVSDQLDGYPMEPRRDTLHVILDSRGGSLDSAYKAVLFLRRFVNDLRVYVPRRAKSAGTLMAIGADTIVMSPFAELGPLDTQIRDPRNPSQDISALDCYQSVDYVRNFGLDSISIALRILLTETRAQIPLTELIKTASDFAIGTVNPMLEQVKALDLGTWGRTLRVGENYARALLTQLNAGDSANNASEIAQRLVYGYTHHPYPIDIDEARRLKLNVVMMPRNVYVAAKDVAAACDGGGFIGFLDDVSKAIGSLGDDLGESTPPMGTPQSDAHQESQFQQAPLQAVVAGPPDHPLVRQASQGTSAPEDGSPNVENP